MRNKKSEAQIEKRRAKQKETKRRYYEKNKELILEKNRLWKLKNPERVAISRRKTTKNSRINNPERAAEYAKKRRVLIKGDELLKLIETMRQTMKSAIRAHCRNKTIGVSDELLLSRFGCDRKALIAHIEAHMEPGMTWANYGEWVVVRTVPFASASTVDDVARLAHYTNCQPMKREESLARAGGLRRKKVP